ncbi:unnamed protein product, partial [marine sediment metagenome]
MRVQDNVTYEEAEEQLGGLENFQKYVYPQMTTIFTGMNDTKFQQLNQMIDSQNKCQIVREWSIVPRHKLKQLKNDGRLPQYVKKAKYFNIICNGVLMFPPYTLMPYHDGNYPINKGIFEMFARPEYYWGNSLPNKIKEDKKWKDGWKTLIRWKGKMSAIPPLITFNGTFVDSDITVPGMITAAPAGSIIISSTLSLLAMTRFLPAALWLNKSGLLEYLLNFISALACLIAGVSGIK